MHRVRLVLASLVAVAAAGGAVASLRAIESNRVAIAKAEAGKAAEAAHQRAADRLTNAVRTTEIRASAAATLSPLLTLLAQLRENKLDGALADTLRDWFHDEAAWAPFRGEFPIYGLAIEGAALDLLEGAAADRVPARDVLRRAADRGLVSEALAIEGRPHLAAAARIAVASLRQPVILFVAKPIDAALLRETAERAGGAVLLSDGKRALADGGAAAEVEALRAVLGKENQGTVADTEGRHAARAAPLAPGVWLWTYAAAPPATAGAGDRARLVVIGLAAAVGLAALFLGLRRPRPEQDPITAAPPTRATAAAAPAEAPVSPYGSTTAVGGAVPPAATAATFGRYTLVEKLGEGGMSQVFTAVTFGAEGFRRRFVVKRLRPELSSDQAAVAQFIDEANLASTLVHSNIVPVFDFGKVGDEYFLATEFILGRDLGRVVARLLEIDGRPLSPALVLHVAHETLKALEFAHTKTGEGGKALGIVHRDVSPGNVLVSSRGEVKLFDFGIVKAEGRVTKTHAGVVKGNVHFMSPEQARGGDVDARADLFSLGLVMAHCLLGAPLYQGNTTYELLVKAAAGPDAADQARLAALPQPVAGLVRRALEADPARRYPTAAAFAAAIAPHLRPSHEELVALMQRLFASDFADEERRFAAAAPSGSSGGLAAQAVRNTATRA